MCVRVGFLDGVFIACKCYSSSKPMFCVNTFSDTFIVINMPCTVQLKLCWSSHLSASRCLCLHSEVVVLLLATLSCWRPQRKSPANVLPSPTSTCCPDDKNIPMAAFLQPCHSWVQWNWGGKKKKGGEEKPYQNIRERKGKKPNLIPWSLLAENRHQDKRWGHPSSIVRSVCRLSLTYDLSLNTCCLSLKRTLLLQKVKKLPTEIIWSIQCSHLTSWTVLLVIIWRGSA